MRQRALTCLLLGLAISLTGLWAAESTQNTDWPQWRGPRRDGISAEKGLLHKWPKGGPSLAWKIDGLGKGYASPSISGGRIYIMGQPADETVLFALDIKQGATLWMKPVGKKWGDGPRGTPTVDCDRVYVIAPEGELVCFATQDGKEIWRTDFIKDFGGALPSWGYCESPLVDGPHVICTPGGPKATLVALDKLTGKVTWQTLVPDIGPLGDDATGGYSSVVVSTGAGIKQYVQLTGRGCVGVRARDGKFLWGYNRICNDTANIPTPIVDGNFVFCSSGYHTGSALLRLSESAGGVTASEVYFLEGRELQNHHGGMVKLGDFMYMGHGQNQGFPTCIEMQTGKIRWKRERGPGSGSASIVAADGQLVFRYEDGTVALIEASPTSYQLNGSFKTPDSHPPCWAHPVVQGGKLYLRDEDQLLVYNISAN